MARRNHLTENPDIPKAKFSKENFKKSLRLFRYMSTRNRWLFALGTLFLAISAGASIMFPKLIGNMMDGVFIYDKTGISTAPNSTKLREIAFYFIYLFAVQALFSFLRIVLYVKVTENMTFSLRKDLYKSVIGQKLEFFQDNRVGEILSRFSSDISQIQDTFTTNLAMFLRQILVGVGGVVLIFYTSKELAFYMLLTIPVIIVIALFFGRFIRNISKEVQDITAKNSVIVEETTSGIVNVKAFTNEKFELNRYVQNADFLQKESIKRGYWRGAFSSFIIVCLFGAIVWLIFMGLGMVQKGELAVGELFNFMLLTAFVGASIGGLAEQFVQIQKTLGAIDRVLDIIDSPIEKNKASKSVPQNATLTLENIEFAYPSRPNNPILKDISLTLSPGTTTALVGPSGSGKTTITALLYQFYHPTSGHIHLNQTGVELFDLHEYRSQFALVPQEVILFGGTILENISYGNPDATMDQIHQAAKDAYCWDFIQDFPEGFNTEVGDRGLKLSGGQKQRIAIARAILRNPQFLILDEATSALDSESEFEVQKALQKLMQNRTSLVIAHRLSTIRNADTILVIKHGKILESGNHTSLMNLEQGIYKNMVEKQLEPGDFFSTID